MIRLLLQAWRELIGFTAPTLVTVVTDAPVPGLDFEFLALCRVCYDRNRDDDCHLHTSRYGKQSCMCHGCGNWREFNFTEQQLHDLRLSSWSHWQGWKPTPYSWPTWTEEQKQEWLNTNKRR